MNTRAVLFVLGLVIGVIAVFLWRKAEIEDLNKQVDDCAERLKQVKSQLASTASVVVVGPTADRLSDPQLPIHVDKQPVVYWKTWEPGHNLQIVFDPKDYPTSVNGEPPFVEGTNSQTQTVRCAGGDCFSYGLNDKVAALFKPGAVLPCPRPCQTTLLWITSSASTISIRRPSMEKPSTATSSSSSPRSPASVRTRWRRGGASGRSSTTVVTQATALNARPLTWSPMRSSRLMSRSMKTRTNGSAMPLATWERNIISDEREARPEDDRRAEHHHRGVDAVERLRLAELLVDARLPAEGLADVVDGRERKDRRREDRGVEEAEGEQSPSVASGQRLERPRRVRRALDRGSRERRASPRRRR